MTTFISTTREVSAALRGERATIVAPESAVEFLKTMLSRPKTVRPDSLAKAGQYNAEHRRCERHEVAHRRERTVELRRVENPHAARMLVAYLPAEKVLFVSTFIRPARRFEPTTPAALPMELRYIRP